MNTQTKTQPFIESKSAQMKRTVWELLKVARRSPPQFASRLRALANEMQVQIYRLENFEPWSEPQSPCSSPPQACSKFDGSTEKLLGLTMAIRNPTDRTLSDSTEPLLFTMPRGSSSNREK